MSTYLIGDIQGCDEALVRLMDHITFSPSKDNLYVLGDLVNRGPDSLGVLRRLRALDGAAHCLLGNHDLHLLAVAQGARKAHRNDTLDSVLQAPDCADLLHWLSHQPMAMAIAHEGVPVLMVHAGVLPAWTLEQTLVLAGEVQTVLRSAEGGAFLAQMYSNLPDHWDEALTGFDRLRVIVNALTRLRFCDAQGRMEFETKEGLAAAPAGYTPWFDAPGRRTAADTVAFGHWSTLGWLNRSDVFSMDTGCVWGGCLSALRLDGPDGQGHLQHTLLQVPCAQALAPGN
jgi:bis(5'-nucleosyl)-tetraphosphatase (symmetrical)